MPTNMKGFSLIEALITVLVLSIGLLGLGQLQARLWAGAGDLHTLGDAYLLGENLLETSTLGWLPVSVRQDLANQSEPVISTTVVEHNPARDRDPLVTTEVGLFWRRPSGEYSLSLTATVNKGLGAEDTRWLLPPELKRYPASIETGR